MQFVVPLAAALVPLVITPGVLAYFDITPKIVILLCSVALTILYFDTNISNLRRLLDERPSRLFLILLTAEWLTMVAATVFSSNPALSLDGGTWRRYGLIPETGLLLFVLSAAGWLARDPRNVQMLLRASTIAAALAAFYGIAQYFGHDPFLPASAYEVGDEPFRIVRPPGTLGHADYFANWLVVGAFLAVALSRLEQHRWIKRAALAVFFVASFAILLTGTRGALLGLLVGIFVLTVARGTRIRGVEIALAAACMAGIVMFFFFPAGGKLRARLHWSIEDARGGARLLLWRDSARMAEHRVWYGFGPETFATEFPRFESVELARAYPDFYHESPHNMFLDTLTCEGILGLCALLGLCGFGAVAAWRAWRSHHALAPPLAAAFAATLVAQQFAVFVFTTSLYFHLLIALLVVAVLPVEQSQATERFMARWIFPLSCAVSLVLIGFSLRLIVADQALAVAEHRIALNDAQGAAGAYVRVLRWQLPGAGADLAYSRSMEQLAGRTPVPAAKFAAGQQALDAGLRALSTAEDRQNAWYNLALLLAARNDPAGVEHALRNAIAWAPNWFKPHWTLAQLLELTNRHAEALAEAQKAVQLNGAKNAEVAETWNKLRARP